MNALFCNLMAALLFVHAVLGCCWHHAQACAACEHAGDKPAACCPHEHQGEHCDHDEAPPAGPCNCKLECRGICTFLPQQKAQFEASQLVTPIDLVADMATLTASQSAGPGGYAHWTFAPAPSAPPLRLHLLHGILLI